MRTVVFLAILAAFCVGVAPAMARRDDKAEHFRRLEREKNRLKSLLKKLKKRDSEVRYIASRLPFMRREMSARGTSYAKYGANELCSQIRDRKLKKLIRAYAKAVDGTPRITEAEKESYMILGIELETSIREFKSTVRHYEKLKADLSAYIPLSMKRNVLKQSRTLLCSRDEKVKAIERLGELEIQVEAERLACARDASRDRNKLREIRGRVAVLRKKLELYEARIAFGTALQKAVEDDILEDSERVLLTRHRRTINYLDSTISGLLTPRHPGM